MSSAARAAPAASPMARDAFDAVALCTWLEASLEGFHGPMRVEPFAGGQSNPTYKLVTAARSYVLRSKPGPASSLLPSAHAIEREFRVLRALADTAVPVPRALCLCEDETVIGRAFYVMEYLEGRILWDPALPGFQVADRTRAYDQLNRVLCALHQVPVEAKGLSDFGRPGNYFARQIARWSRQYQAASVSHDEAMDRLVAWLPANMPASACKDGPPVLVHGDFRIDNLMFDVQGTRPIAVLDWELSTLGHPLADLSYHCLAWHLSLPLFRGIAGVDLRALGIPQEQAFVASFCDRTEVADPSELRADWNFYLAYNLFRMAAIGYGVARRLRHAMTAPDGDAAADRAGRFARLAWDTACRA